MDWQLILNFISKISWPITILIILIIFKEAIKDLIFRIREFEGAGSKVSLDAYKVKEILEKGKDKTAEDLAKQIIDISRDKREYRILRALFDDKGRAIYAYQSSFYKSALQSLLDENLVERVGNGYGLTDEGFRLTKEYLQDVK